MVGVVAAAVVIVSWKEDESCCGLSCNKERVTTENQQNFPQKNESSKDKKPTMEVEK